MDGSRMTEKRIILLPSFSCHFDPSCEPAVIIRRAAKSAVGIQRDVWHVTPTNQAEALIQAGRAAFHTVHEHLGEMVDVNHGDFMKAFQ